MRSFLWLLLLSTSCVRPVELDRLLPFQSDYFLVLLVDARHLDYSSGPSLLRTIAKHPSDGSKNGDVGHAWVYLQGIMDGQPVFLEGGHSGELGVIQAKYFHGIIDYFEAGDANPIRYLWECQHDGFFQWGNGGHSPTYAAKIDLTRDQFLEILNFIEEYPFRQYYLTGNQCSSFASKIAELAGLPLEDKVTLSIEPSLNFERERLNLWTDSRYSEITLSSPDVLEANLMAAVEMGRAHNALDWYLHTHRPSLISRLSKSLDDLKRLPERYYRYRLMSKINEN